MAGFIIIINLAFFAHICYDDITNHKSRRIAIFHTSNFIRVKSGSFLRVKRINGKEQNLFSTVVSAAINGIESKKVMVEADVSDGMPVFSMVGFLASEVKEAQDRVRTALKNSDIHLPAKRITVNLSPADLKKAGSGFDLPIAIAVLASLGYIPQESLKGILFAGELSLNGEINDIRGVMEIVSGAAGFGCHTCVIPQSNLREGSVIRGVRVLGAKSIKQVLYFLTGEGTLAETSINIEEIRSRQEEKTGVDFSEVQGQALLRRAAEVAVSGLHNLLIIGPPGSGKTMTARRIPTILPQTTLEEALEISKLHSIAGILPEEVGLRTVRPFRSPHHTITPIALAGGGSCPKPGEVSLAHRGVLYLDELPEFEKNTLEILRQPLEEGKISISRNTGSYLFPADFMLVASMNPCKCGYYPDRNRCSCSVREVKRYLNHISQPLLDRIDICVEAKPILYEELKSFHGGENSSQIRERVTQAQKIQQFRYQGTKYRFNSDLSAAGIKKYCTLGKEEEELMREAFEKLNLTARSYNRILKVARTIADLEGEEYISTTHLGEAVCYRALDKKYWMERM